MDGQGVAMSDQGGDFIEQLQRTGFFEQVGNLQTTLSKLSEDIAAIGDQANQRLDEMESIAAHVMAIEAVLAVLLKTHALDPDEVRAEVAKRTGDLSDYPDGSPTVQAVAADLAAG